MRMTASIDLIARTGWGRRVCLKWQAPEEGAWRVAAATTLSDRAEATATARLEVWALIKGRGVPKAGAACSVQVEPCRPVAKSRSRLLFYRISALKHGLEDGRTQAHDLSRPPAFSPNFVVPSFGLRPPLFGAFSGPICVESSISHQ